MRQWWFSLILGLTACVAVQLATTPAEREEAILNNYGPAPELTNEKWLNTGGQALRLADLRGKVVALDMWTYG